MATATVPQLPNNATVADILRHMNLYLRYFPGADGSPTITSGTGSPEGVVAGPVGRLYEQKDGVNGSVLWVKVTGGSTTAGWQLACFHDQRANAQRFLAKLTRGVEDCSLELISDSTGGPTYWWPIFLASFIAQFPAYTVINYQWQSGTSSYDAGTTLQTGTGAQTLRVYTCQVAGYNTANFLVPNFAAMIQVVQPDFCFISLGHNENAIAAQWGPQYLELVFSVVQACPHTSICVIAQNPQAGNTTQEQKATVYADIAAGFGMGFIDICQLFNENGGAAVLDKDGVHPNAAGTALWATAVTLAMHYADHGAVAPSTFPWPSGSDELLTNGDFSNYVTTPGAPYGWIAFGGATVTKDTVNYESPNGYSVNAQAAAGAPGGIEQRLSGLRLAGNWLTVICRLRVPLGQPTTCGEVGIYDGVNSSSASRFTFQQGGFRYVVWQQLIAPTSTTVTVLLYGDNSTQGGNTSFDRASARIGKVPILGVANGAVALERLQPGVAPDGTYQFGSNSGTFNRILLNAAAGVARIFAFLSAGVTRVLFSVNGTETGGNAGSDLFGQFYDDAGTLIDQWLTVRRKLGGLVTLTRTLMALAFGATQSADNGDAGVTLTWGTSAGIQRWSTPLTAPRTAIVIASGVPNGAAYLITREASASGAFPLYVGTSGAICTLNAGQWAIISFDGASYRVLARGGVGTSPSAGGLGSVAVPFTDGDTVRRVTVTDAAVSASSLVQCSVQRPSSASDAADKGYLYVATPVNRAAGTFDVLIQCLGWGGKEPDEDPPNETVTLVYTVG